MKLNARVLAPLAIAIFLTPALSLQAQNTVDPAIRSIEYPKVELFLGYSHFGTVSNDTVAGNRMVGLERRQRFRCLQSESLHRAGRRHRRL